jgi:hypothetical protein
MEVDSTSLGRRATNKTLPSWFLIKSFNSALMIFCYKLSSLCIGYIFLLFSDIVCLGALVSVFDSKFKRLPLKSQSVEKI